MAAAISVIDRTRIVTAVVSWSEQGEVKKQIFGSITTRGIPRRLCFPRNRWRQVACCELNH